MSWVKPAHFYSLLQLANPIDVTVVSFAKNLIYNIHMSDILEAVLNRDSKAHINSLLKLPADAEFSEDYLGGLLDERLKSNITYKKGRYFPQITYETQVQPEAELAAALFPLLGVAAEYPGPAEQSRWRFKSESAVHCREILQTYAKLLLIQSPRAELLLRFLRQKEFVGAYIDSSYYDEMVVLRGEVVETPIQLSPQRLAGMFDAGLGSIYLTKNIGNSDVSPAVNIKTPHLGLIRGIILCLQLRDNEYTTPKSDESHHLLRLTGIAVERFIDMLIQHVYLRRGILSLTREFQETQRALQVEGRSRNYRGEFEAHKDRDRIRVRELYLAAFEELIRAR